MSNQNEETKVLYEVAILAIESLAKEIWTEHYTGIIGKGQVDYMLDRFQTVSAISEQINEGVLYFLIRADGKFIGYIAMKTKSGELFLSKIYVKLSHRTRGYGKKAMRFVERLAKKKGLGKISLTVNKNNAIAIRAYEKLGFKNLGSVVQDIGGGFVMDDFRMKKDLLCGTAAGMRTDEGPDDAVVPGCGARRATRRKGE